MYGEKWREGDMAKRYGESWSKREGEEKARLKEHLPQIKSNWKGYVEVRWPEGSPHVK